MTTTKRETTGFLTTADGSVVKVTVSEHRGIVVSPEAVEPEEPSGHPYHAKPGELKLWRSGDRGMIQLPYMKTPQPIDIRGLHNLYLELGKLIVDIDARPINAAMFEEQTIKTGW